MKYPQMFIVLMLVLGLAAFSIRWYVLSVPIRETRALVDEEVDRLMSQVQNGKIDVDVDWKVGAIIVDCNTRDAWNQLLGCSVHIDNNFVSVVCLSIGPDGIPGNSDDIVGQSLDLNKSRIIGNWVGTKWKQASRGFVDGSARKSPFDKDKVSTSSD